MKELELGFIPKNKNVSELEDYATPFDRETGILGKKETIKTHVWKITENGKKLAIALLGPHKIKWK